MRESEGGRWAWVRVVVLLLGAVLAIVGAFGGRVFEVVVLLLPFLILAFVVLGEPVGRG